MASLEDIQKILKKNKDEIVAELGIKLLPIQQDISQLQSIVANLHSRIYTLESRESRFRAEA